MQALPQFMANGSAAFKHMVLRTAGQSIGLDRAPLLVLCFVICMGFVWDNYVDVVARMTYQHTGVAHTRAETLRHNVRTTAQLWCNG